MPKASLPHIPPLNVPHREQIQASDREATLSLIVAYLQASQPVIAFVDTGELAYWSVATNHAVVVIGLDPEHVIVNDPAFASAPQRIPRGEFELAWLNCDNACAVVNVQALV